MQVPHITLKQYINGQNVDQVNYVLRYGNIRPEDLFKIGDIMKRPFGLVKDCQSMFQVGSTWERYINFLIDEFKINSKVIQNESIYKLHSSRLWLREQIIKINELESNNLGHTSEGDEHSAGIEVFSKYGPFLQFDSLAGGDVTKIEEVKKVPYEICFTKLLLNKDSNEYEKALNRIRMNKIK